MATMKCPNMSGGGNMAVSGNGGPHVDDVDLFSSSCWPGSGASLQTDFIDINQKLILDGTISNLGGDKLLLGSPVGHDDGEIIEAKVNMDALDTLLNSQQLTTSLAELKPLPPFTGYTANLSINGIQGHHYHTISQRIPEENNNSYGNFGEQNIVSSSTCAVGTESAGSTDDVVKLAGYGDCVSADGVVSSGKIFDDCGHPLADSVAQIKTEMGEYDMTTMSTMSTMSPMGNIDIASIIGSAMADTTVPGNSADTDEANTSRDSWMDIDAWIDHACIDQHKSLIITQDGLSEFIIPGAEFGKGQQAAPVAVTEYGAKMQPQQATGSTLQTLLTHGYMPLLQNRLQNGPPIKQETPSSTNYGSEMISTSSPPSNVVSTTDSLMLNVNGRFLSQYGVHGGMADDHRIHSPEMMGGGQNYPHTTTTGTPTSTKKPRSRAQKKQQAASSTVFQAEQNLGLLGKEKPVHRCSICNRGFLNKSNIKVHLRTHTGEKPFRCDTCAKAFRQKAHLLKHQQIHKRIGRD